MRDTKLKPLLIFLPLGLSASQSTLHLCWCSRPGLWTTRLICSCFVHPRWPGCHAWGSSHPAFWTTRSVCSCFLHPWSPGYHAWRPSHPEIWTTCSMCHAWRPWQAKLTKFVSGMDVAVCKEFWSFTPLVSFFPRLRVKIMFNLIESRTRHQP